MTRMQSEQEQHAIPTDFPQDSFSAKNIPIQACKVSKDNMRFPQTSRRILSAPKTLLYKHHASKVCLQHIHCERQIIMPLRVCSSSFRADFGRFYCCLSSSSTFAHSGIDSARERQHTLLSLQQQSHSLLNLHMLLAPYLSLSLPCA